MKQFEIITDTCCDLPYEYIKSKNIPYVRLTFGYNEKEYFDDFGNSLDYKQFYKEMNNGAIVKTSQPSSDSFYSKFKEIVKEGKDLIYICVSSGLSGTLNSSNIAKNMIEEEFPEAKVHIVDVLTASLGQGLFVMKAYEMKEQGASFNEIINYIENNVQKMNTYMLVDDLIYLKRGGRISHTAAILGIVLHIRPILTLNHEGRVIPVIKVKGRKKAINKIAEIVIERIERPKEQRISISHADCIEEALKLKELILEQVKVNDIIINNIGPAVGAFGGPGSMAVSFLGRERQHHIIEN